MNLRTALLSGTVLALALAAAPIAASAEPVSGIYIGAGAGVNFLQNETIKGFQTPTGTLGTGINPKFDAGGVGVASIGYGFGNGLRTEIEANYRYNNIRGASDALGARGNEQKYGAMLNVLYDFDVSQYGIPWVAPYIGAGAGWAHQDWNKVDIYVPGATAAVNESSDNFAYQVIAGVSYSLSDYVPGLSLTAEYRFFSEPNPVKFGALVTPTGGPALQSRVKVGDNLNHSILVGFRYALNAPPPAPPPAPAPVATPAPAPARTYLVFFDWDKADLTDRAREVIAQAAQASTRVQYTRIDVSGYADRTGTAAYNQALSLRRAQVVEGELVRLGVPQSAIDIHAYGDTHPLVPTAAGVREPQNRRVEIVLH